MAISPRLELRQSQSLVMTPQLQQAIKMLQLSNLDLTAYVDAELERNPLLERDEDDTAPAIEEPGGDGPSEKVTDLAEGAVLDLAAGAALEDAAANCDTDIENLYPDAGTGDLAGRDGPSLATLAGTGTGASGGTAGSGFAGDDFDPMANVAADLTLKDHLTAQMLVAVSDPTQRMIAATLIDLVDEAGYLTEPTEEVADRLGTDLEAVEGVLAGLCGFEPAGVFARTLADCLTYQLAERGEFDAPMQALMANLHLVAAHDLAGLARACGTDKAGVAELVARIKRLNPKPGLAYGGGIVQPLIPDVFVRAMPDGSWAVELNADTLPKVLVDQSYYATVARNARSAPEKTYLSDCLQDANWLVKSLDQRARTILKVARQIVRQQDAFLVLGVAYLRPLNLRTVADAIEMHESTVSRVTANKYIATPRGIFQMKYFFSSAIASTGDGDALSAVAVRHKLKALIMEEKPDRILSDDRLVELLREAGIDIARRTIAKYREAMNIPSSVQRRRAKRAHAPHPGGGGKASDGVLTGA
ncbi:RNA polymerase sigma-54 factor RpoN [hydrothermal vent metagenome]|uniref:RNA polymerase sigma-54 factor RpoN n=1 Tax=hydrothermal vent metagenome TaxID=652676 RepID=A0A3B0T8T8_9ZZZZ